jgi:Tol biopolymer transport system component
LEPTARPRAWDGSELVTHGKQLVFTYEIGHGGRGLGGGLERIFAMNTDGSARHLLPIPSVGSRRFEDWAPAWSPDGSRIAFTRTVWPTGTDHTGTTDLGRSAIYVLDLVHGGLRRVSMPADGGELPAFVAWSPDGQRLAYLGEPGPVGRSYTVGSLGLACTGLHVTNADGTADHVLAAASRLPDGRDGCVPIWSAAWSPDGHSIAFARSTQPFTGGVDLYLISPNGKHLHRLWHQSNVVNGSATWSADGKRIAFSFGRRVSPGPGGGEPTQIRTLAVIDRDGSHRHTILRVRGDMYLAGGPAWQPR